MSDFFISFSSDDTNWAEWIAFALETDGYSVIFQPWDFRPGSNFVLEMDRSVREAERVVAVLSPSYLSSRYARIEWAEAVRRDPVGHERRLIPVRVKECDTSGLLGSVIYIDFTGLQTKEEARRKLLAGVRMGRAKPHTEPSFPSDRIIQVASRSFGIIRHDESGDPVSMNFIFFDDLLPKHANFHVLTQAEGQCEVSLTLTESMSNAFQTPLEECGLLGECILGFARPLPKGSPIDIGVTLNSDGILSISARDKKTGTKIDAQFKTEAVTTRDAAGT
jgi:hypothetical protein